MRIFYERVSTEHQSLARQDELLKKLNIEKSLLIRQQGSIWIDHNLKLCWSLLEKEIQS